MIGDTLRAALTGTMRRSHELYDHEKISLLYKIILAQDEGSGSGDDQTNIERLIIQLNDKAKKVIEEEEKKKRRRTGAKPVPETPIETQEDDGTQIVTEHSVTAAGQ